MKQLLEKCTGWLSAHPDDETARELLEQVRSRLKAEEGYFVVSVVSRDDLVSEGYDGYATDDSTMERIASSMGKAHTEYGEYRLSLRNACGNENVPLLEE